MRVVVGNQKGGVGKTTSAVFLAACAAADDARVLLLDADADQAHGTSWVWSQAIPDRRWDCLRLHDVKDEAQLDGYDDVIIDAPASNPSRMVQLLSIADSAIVVVGPMAAEVHAVGDAIALARGKAVRVLVCRYDLRRRTADELSGALEDMGIRRFRQMIPRRAEIEDCYLHHPISTIAGWGAYRAVWRELAGSDHEYELVGADRP